MEIDWSLAPPEARWWAMDADGQAHWFLQPEISDAAGYWHSSTKRAPTFGFEGSWRDSLRQRPQVSLKLRALR